jgi:transposase InsO family protein
VWSVLPSPDVWKIPEPVGCEELEGLVESPLLTFLRLLFAGRAALIAENFFLCKQLALFKERKVRPRRISRSTRVALLALARFFDWREALAIVKPDTFIKWHRSAFRVFWRWKSRKRGRPPLPKNLRELIREMHRENPTWGEERIADELKLKLGIEISPRTVGRYLDSGQPRGGSGQRWATFVRNHAKAVVACDFLTSVTVNFRVLYVFVAMEIGSRRILHCNVTEHPTADWTTQQFREFLAFDHPCRFVIHDRDGIFAPCVDQALRGFGVRALKTPARTPTANAFCERLIGTIRRECLDFLIPLNERHLRRIVAEFVTHYNRGRPHSALGPGIPEPPQASVPVSGHRHKLPEGFRVESTPVLGGLHHEYRLEKEAA